MKRSGNVETIGCWYDSRHWHGCHCRLLCDNASGRGRSASGGGRSASGGADAISRANPDIAPDIIAALPPVLRSSSMRIGSDITADTPIIYPDGSPVPGQSATKMAQAAKCGGPYAFVIAKVSTSTCGVAGNSSTRMVYVWNAAPPTKGCVAVEAFDNVANKRFTSAGCGSNGRKTATWGNVLSRPRIKATSGDLTFRGGWTHATTSGNPRCVSEKYVTPPSKSKNSGRIKCPTVFKAMRARVTAGSGTLYGKRVGANSWSRAVFSPGYTVSSIYAVK